MQQLNIFSVNGSPSLLPSLDSTGRKVSFGATLPTLLPTPKAQNANAPGPSRKGNKLDVQTAIHNLQSSPAAFPASPSATPDEEKERRMNATSGRTCLQLYKTSNPNGSSLKTCVASLLGTTAWYSNKCALTWKPKVTKSNRLLFQLSPSTRRTEGTGSGSSDTILATPNTMDSMEPKTPKALLKESTVTRPGRTNLSNLRDQIAYGQKMPNPEAILTGTGTGKKLRLQPAMTQWMMGFPESWTEFPTTEQSGGKTA